MIKNEVQTKAKVERGRAKGQQIRKHKYLNKTEQLSQGEGQGEGHQHMY